MTHDLSFCYHNKRVTFRIKVRVRVRARVKVRVNVRVRIRYSRSTHKHNRILSTVTIKYIGIFVIKNPSSGIWSCPFSIIISKTFPNGCDVIGCQFEKVKNGHIFENWTTILRIGRRLETGHRSESYIYT
jgi:hypothetical protein